MINRFFRHRPLRYLLWAGLGAVIALLSLLRSGFGLIYFWADALSTAGAVLILLGLLGLAASCGAFDTFRFSFSTLKSRRYRTLYDFNEAHKEKRKRSEWGFALPLTLGAAYLLIAIMLSLAV